MKVERKYTVCIVRDELNLCEKSGRAAHALCLFSSDRPDDLVPVAARIFSTG